MGSTAADILKRVESTFSVERGGGKAGSSRKLLLQLPDLHRQLLRQTGGLLLRDRAGDGVEAELYGPNVINPMIDEYPDLKLPKSWLLVGRIGSSGKLIVLDTRLKQYLLLDDSSLDVSFELPRLDDLLDWLADETGDGKAESTLASDDGWSIRDLRVIATLDRPIQSLLLGAGEEFLYASVDCDHFKATEHMRQISITGTKKTPSKPLRFPQLEAGCVPRYLDIASMAAIPGRPGLLVAAMRKWVTVLDLKRQRYVQSWGLESDEKESGISGRSVSVSPDESLAAATHDDKSVRIWSLRTGEEVAKCVGHNRVPNVVRFLPDGRLASAGSDGVVLLWDPQAGKVDQEIKLAKKFFVAHLVAAADRRLVVGGENSSISVYDLATGSLLSQHKITKWGNVPSMVGMPGGQHLLVGTDDGSLLLVELETGGVLASASLPPFEEGSGSSRIGALTVVPDGRRAFFSVVDRQAIYACDITKNDVDKLKGTSPFIS
jgi:hypothetical protein